jgi:predicted DNA-binding transcriptional regulator YafY
MRAERLVTLLFLLQQRRRATAAELAEALAVSERTVYRDIAALLAAGVPLWTEQGRSGGIRLMDGWRTRLDGLTGKEAAAIFAVGVPEVLAELGLGAALTGARAKVLATLPAGLREYAARVSDRFHLDAPGWFHQPEEVSELATVAAAVADTRRLRVRYGRPGRTVERLLEQLGLVVKAGVWYLIAQPVTAVLPPDGPAADGQASAGPVPGAVSARGGPTASDELAPGGGSTPGGPTADGQASDRPAPGAGSAPAGPAAGAASAAGAGSVPDGPRTYRVARIAEATLDVEFERPPFDLVSWWSQTSARFERSLLRDRVRLRLGPRAQRRLAEVTDREAAAEALVSAAPADEQGWREVSLDVESEQVALTQLTALGVEVEVLSPASLRAGFAEVGLAMAARNAPPG